MTVTLEDVKVTVRLLTENAPVTVEGLMRALPITSHARQCMWSGLAVVCDLPEGTLSHDRYTEHAVCSVYPGTLVALPETDQLVMSYGTMAELRSSSGVEYGTRVGELSGDYSEFLKKLASRGALGATAISFTADPS